MIEYSKKFGKYVTVCGILCATGANRGVGRRFNYYCLAIVNDDQNDDGA